MKGVREGEIEIEMMVAAKIVVVFTTTEINYLVIGLFYGLL